jgi:hypothetical protein
MSHVGYDIKGQTEMSGVNTLNVYKSLSIMAIR